MCVMTLLFEGDEDEVKINERRIFGVAKMFGGISAGESNGERGYMLTFVIAYIRVSPLFVLSVVNYSNRSIDSKFLFVNSNKHLYHEILY